MKPQFALALACVWLGSCASVLESNEPAVQTYVLRAGTTAATPETTASRERPVLHIEALRAGPGLDSDHIVLLRADRRFDSYAGSRWADEVPSMLEALVVDALRDSGAYHAVFGDAAPFPADYTVAITIRRFEADYSASERAPTVHVVFEVAVGRRSDRALLGAFSIAAQQAAAENRMSAVVAAFEAATQRALADLTQQVSLAAQKVDRPEPSIKR
jgi:cholesterol transport system auxiliary component